MKLTTLGFVTLAVAAIGYFAPQAQAEQTPENLSDAMTRAVFNQSGDLYRNGGIDRQFTQFVGLSYSDNEYRNDAQSVENVYREGMRQQTSKDNVVRTVDLPNPFNTSLRSSNQ